MASNSSSKKRGPNDDNAGDRYQHLEKRPRAPLQERVAKTERVVDEAKRDKDKAERKLDEAETRLKSLEESNASDNEIARAYADVQAARADVSSARTVWAAAMETHKAAIEAESRAVESARNPFVGARLVLFSFNPDVRARLERPLSAWQAGETFDVSGIADAVGAEQWHNQLYLRAEGLALLRQWEDDAPYLAVYGTPGVGKSTLLQLAALRALAKGEPVFLRMRDVDKLIRVDDDEHLSVERLTLDDLSHEGRPRTKNTVMCYDSPAGFQKKVGHANHFKKVFIVHSPSGDLNNTMKSDGVVTRFYPVPPESELLAVGAIKGVDAVQVRERIARFGPTFRYLTNVDEAEKAIAAGIAAMIDAGVEGLVKTSRATRDVHRITLMKRKPTPYGEMLVFASNYVRDEVVRRLANTHAIDLLRLVNTVDLHGSLRGQVFESRMLDTLSHAGANIEFTTSRGGGAKVLQIAGAGVTLYMVDSALALPEGDAVLHHRVLYRPPHANNASWDALIVEDDTTAYLLQMTVSDEHAVKRHGLEAGKKLLTTYGFSGSVQLVFLVPPVVFQRFRLPQKILNADGKASETAVQWRQDLWHVATVDGAAYWPPTH